MIVKWKDGETSWTPLKYLKEGDPVIKEKYFVENNFSEDPTFACWVPDTPRKRDQIISKVKSMYWKKTHKFGIMMPKNAYEA